LEQPELQLVVFVSEAFVIVGKLTNTTAPKTGNAFFAACLKNSLLD